MDNDYYERFKLSSVNKLLQINIYPIFYEKGYKKRLILLI